MIILKARSLLKEQVQEEFLALINHVLCSSISNSLAISYQIS
jgi:hypothetical protein